MAEHDAPTLGQTYVVGLAMKLLHSELTAVIEDNGRPTHENVAALGALLVRHCIRAGVSVEQAVHMVRVTYEKLEATESTRKDGGT